ncbi:hypothetical protein HAX54_042606 [Datura stramonium]|uniref:C2H2-type domain-containing protein n=1 Tax=Datura stramonium TaxID=4076 RepID=A0ABS8RNZ3_DATST|nr:hypothetical protein [Datura stramonium]
MMKRSREDDGGVEAQAMANCLMLLSSIDRDRRNSFECKTCKKRFSSFQALGGHRTSHRSLKSDAGKFLHGKLTKNRKVVHECSVCGMEFSMGQALGGHMRRHRAPVMNDDGSAAAKAIPVLKKSNSSKRIFCVDLNLTPDENDDFQLWPTVPAPVLRCFI